MSKEHDLNKYGFWRSPESVTECMAQIRATARQVLAAKEKQEQDSLSPLNTPQPDMFEKEFAIELLKQAGILDEDGELKGTFKGTTR